MNADAYLKRHGWRGAGHSLDHTDRGIRKPLLITHKQDQLGLGKKSAAHNVSDQWWMRAFDQSLQNIGTGQESTLTQVRKQGINRGGLYSFFVKGEGLSGTVTEESSGVDISQSNSSASPSRASTPATSASGASDQSESSDTSDLSEDDTMSVDTSSSAEVAPRAQAGTSTKRKREEKETSRNLQKRRKLENMVKTLEKAKANDNGGVEAVVVSDPELERQTAVRRRIDHEVNIAIEARTKKGDFGPAEFLASRKNNAKKPAFIEHPETGKKVAYKKVKHGIEKKIRSAKKVLKRNMVVDAMLSGELPNPNGYTREQALKNYEKDSKATKKKDTALRKLNRKLNKLNEEKKLTKAESKAAKIERRKERKAKIKEFAAKEREETARGGNKENKESEAIEDVESTERNDKVAEAAESTINKKKVPGWGEMDRYPTKREKKERKMAAEAGLTVAEYRAKAETEQKQDAISAKIAKLSDEEKAQYEARASAKNQTLEQYVSRRIQKKEAERAAVEEPLPFFTDLEGDASIVNKVKNVEVKQAKREDSRQAKREAIKQARQEKRERLKKENLALQKKQKKGPGASERVMGKDDLVALALSGETAV